MGYLEYIVMRQKIQARKTAESEEPTRLYYDEEQDDSSEPDLHQCGHCKLMFNNLTKYITHKLQKTCWEENTTTEDTVWSPERNGSLSPETSVRSELDEQHSPQPNIEVRNLHHELQRRKHRKGFVRRIKPSLEIRKENESIESLTQVFIQDEDETVFVQEAEPSDENDDIKSVGPEFVASSMDTNSMKSSEVTSKFGKYRTSIYNYPKSSRKSTFLLPDDTENFNDIRSSKDYSYAPRISPEPSYESSNIATYNEQHPGIGGSSSSSNNDKYDRIPSKLPQVMSTGGSPVHHASPVRHFNNRDRSRMSYERYNIDYHLSKYYNVHDSDTASTWANQYRADKRPATFYSKNAKPSKYDTYSPHDKYRSMVTLQPEERMQQKEDFSFDTRPVLPTKENNKIEKEDSDKKKEDNVPQSTESAVSFNEPPELVRISEMNEEHTKESYSLKSPPALEKCDTLLYDTNVKVEEDSRDSINEPVEETSPEENKESCEQKTTEVDENSASNKFHELSSPEKESNSPQGSTHSYDTEDFTQEPPSTDAIESLPRHRQLSESTVERLITEPISQADASWKHAKQVYRCPLCAKIFPFKSKLQRHVLVHTGIKPYKCTVCGRGFTQQIDLQRHLTRHTGEKPFKCHLCKAQFIRADNLRKHCKDAHYINIEEPIRKRRRKTTGSDTVLPPLEVAIALALSETERNGGRVLGRAVTRSNARATVTKARSQPKFYQPSVRPEEGNPVVYVTHPLASSRSELPPVYQGGFPSHVNPKQHDLRYPFQPDNNQPYPLQRRPKSADYVSNSPPYKKREASAYPKNEPPRYYQNIPPPLPPPGQNYYQPRGAFEKEQNDFYFQQRERAKRQADARLPPDYRAPEQNYPVDYRGVPVDPRASGYVHRRPVDHLARRPSNERDYHNQSVSQVTLIPRKIDENEVYLEQRRMDEDYGRPRKQNYNFRTHSETGIYTGSPSDGEYIRPRSEINRNDPALRRDEPGGDPRRQYSRHHFAPQPVVSSGQYSDKEDHRAAFRDKPSINYGDYGPSMTNQSRDTSCDQPRDHRQDFELSSLRKSDTPTADPGEFVSMATRSMEETQNSPSSPIEEPKSDEDKIAESPPETILETNMYVDEQEIPIVTPSDDLVAAPKVI